MNKERWSQQQALSHQTAMAKQPKRCLVEIDGPSGFALFPRALPMACVFLMESYVSPPRVSATSGMKSTPTERQSERWFLSFG